MVSSVERNAATISARSHYLPDVEQELIKIRQTICSYVSEELRPFLQSLALDIWLDLQEIRLRVGRPLTFMIAGACYFFDGKKLGKDWRQCDFLVSQQILKDTVLLMSHHSFYALEQEFQHGFITIPGGHRIGIAGKGILKNGQMQTMQYISGLNIRIAKNIPGSSRELLPYLWQDGKLQNTLLIGPPGSGKTTLLRDMGKSLSDGIMGNCLQVGMIDERSEIASSFLGVPQLAVGVCTDVLDGVPKSVGMEMFLRVMGHDVMLTDEISTAADCAAICDLCSSGVRVIASAHGFCLEDLLGRRHLSRLLQEKRFQRYIVLSKKNGVGTVEGIYNAELQLLKEAMKCG